MVHELLCGSTAHPGFNQGGGGECLANSEPQGNSGALPWKRGCGGYFIIEIAKHNLWW